MRFSYDYTSIRAHRLHRQLPIEALALGVGRSVRTVQMWESGRSTPSPEQIAALCEVLEVWPCMFYADNNREVQS